MSVKIVNLTPHALNIHCDDDRIITVKPSGDIARISVATEKVGGITSDDGIVPLYSAVYGDIEGLPTRSDGVVFIVSGMVAAQVHRLDVFSPGELIRDDKGRPIGCLGLKRSR